MSFKADNSRWVFTLLFLCLVSPGSAETIQLKDNISVSGNILAEKKDHVVVDLGFTALTIPKQQIVKIIRGGKNDGPAAVELSTKDGFFKENQGTPPELPVRDWVKRIGEAVVQVRTPGGLGSGFFINEEGFLITNFHVIEGETQISVDVYHQENNRLARKSYRQVRIVALHKFSDLALLKIESPDAPKFVPVPLGETDTLAVGEVVFAIGSPLGLERTVTEGILSTKTRLFQGELYLQTTAQINPGNSGGALFNLRGEVVGVINMKSTLGEGLGFAIPVDGLRYFLDHRDAYAYDNDNPSNPFRYLEPVKRSVSQDSSK